MATKLRSFSPTYTRIRVELCAARRKHGTGTNLYLTTSFSVSSTIMDYMEVCEKICGAFGEGIRNRAELELRLKDAIRRAAEDLPQSQALDVKDLAQRVAHYRDLVQTKLEMKYLPAVLARVAMTDFRRYPKLVQRDLLLYLGKQEKKAYHRLLGRGLRWKTYEKGNAASLFRKPIKLIELSLETPIGGPGASTTSDAKP